MRLGDDTAYLAGRLTLNPLAHLELFGSVLLPLMLLIGTQHSPTGPIYFAWAKPVPVNPTRFRRDITMRTGMSIVAAAGPMSNILLALLFAVIYRISLAVPNPYLITLASLASVVVVTNLYLAFFNFIPIPPLDGSKALLHFMSPNTAHAFLRLEPYGFFIILLLFYLTPVGSIVGILTAGARAFLLGS